MSITQLSLFEEKVVMKKLKSKKQFLNSTNSHVDTKVTAYRIIDKKTNRSYIGVSMELGVRLATHKKGVHSNKELNELMNTRPEDVEYERIEEFDDPNYKVNSQNSRATKIESYLIQYYNTIENGMNTALYFHYDYTDISFWKEVLTPRMYENYIMADKSLLNQRSLKYYSNKQVVRQNNKPYNKEIKIWIIDYIRELENRGIKVYVLAETIGKIDRHNLFKLMNRDDYGAVSNKKLICFIRKLEDQVGIPQRDFPNPFD